MGCDLVWKAFSFNTALLSISRVLTDLYFLANSVHSVTSAQSTSPTVTLYTDMSCTAAQLKCSKVTVTLCGEYFSYGTTESTGSGPPHFEVFDITLRHTSLGMTPL